MTRLLARPDFTALPAPMREFITGLDGLEPGEQLNLIHQYTRDLIKYTPSANEATDIPQNFAQTLASPKGDCDDIALFEAGLVKAASTARCPPATAAVSTRMSSSTTSISCRT